MAKKSKNYEKTAGYIAAQVFGLYGTGPATYLVPVIMTVIPELPEIILIKGKWAAVKISDSPLSYRLARTAKAKRADGR